jgi:hypothetical protein
MSPTPINVPMTAFFALTGRDLVHIAREPLQLSDVTIQPVLFTLLFVYIFGAGVSLPGGGNYKDFAIAGLVILFPLAFVSNSLVPTLHMHPVVASVLWSLVLLAIFAPLASLLYRRRTTD